MNTINKKRIVLSFFLSFLILRASRILLMGILPKYFSPVNIGGWLLSNLVIVLIICLLIKKAIEGEKEVVIKIAKDVSWVTFLVMILSAPDRLLSMAFEQAEKGILVLVSSATLFLIATGIAIFINNVIYAFTYDFLGKLIYGFFPNGKGDEKDVISKERGTVIFSYSIALIIFNVLFAYFYDMLSLPSFSSGATIYILIYRSLVKFLFLALLLKGIMSKKISKVLTIFAVYGLFISLNILLNLSLLSDRNSIFFLIYGNISSLLLLFILTKGHLEKKGYLYLLFKASIIMTLMKILRAIIHIMIKKAFYFEILLMALRINFFTGMISNLIVIGLSIPAAHFIYKHLIGIIIDVKDGK